MPLLNDLFFGENGEVGIINPAIKKFLQANLWRFANQINRKASEQEAFKLRIQIREFNEAISDPEKTKEDYVGLIKKLLSPYVGLENADKLIQSFDHINYLESKKLAILSRVENPRLRSVLLEFARLANLNLTFNNQTQVIVFDPTIEQVNTLNRLVSSLVKNIHLEKIANVIQEAFGENICKLSIILKDYEHLNTELTHAELTLEKLIAVTDPDLSFEFISIHVQNVVESVKAFSFLGQIYDPLLKRELKKHIAANAQFQGVQAIYGYELENRLLLVPYNENLEKYAKAIDLVLQQIAEGVYAQAKFNGQGLPENFFSGNGPAANFKLDLHRLAPLNLILEPTLRSRLRKYALEHSELKLQLAHVKRLNKQLAKLDLADEQTIGEKLDAIIQAAWQTVPAIPPTNYFDARFNYHSQLQAEHQRVKSLYLIVNDFLRTQLLMAATSSDKMLEFNNTKVEEFLLLIGDAINLKNDILQPEELEKIAKIIWRNISFLSLSGELIRYYDEFQRTQALYLINRPALRNALLNYAFSPGSFKFSPSIKDVKSLNELINEQAGVGLKTAEVYDEILHASKLIAGKFFAVDGSANLEAEKNITEANRLYPLYRIYFKPLRHLLIRYAILHPETVWEVTKVDKLNSILHVEGGSQTIDHFAIAISSIWHDIPKTFAELVAAIRLPKSQQLDFNNKKTAVVLNAISRLNKLLSGAVNLKEWFAVRPVYRDAVVEKLIKYSNESHKEIFEKVFFEGICSAVKRNTAGDDGINSDLLNRLKTQLIDTSMQLVIAEEIKTNSIPQVALRDLLGLARHYKANYLLEFKQPLVKQALVEYWGQHTSEYPDFLQDIGQTLTNNNSNEIVTTLTSIFMPYGSDTQKDEFARVLLLDVAEGGAGLNTESGIKRLQGRVRLYQLEVLGLPTYVNSILNLPIDQRDRKLEALGKLDQINWVRWLANLIELNEFSNDPILTEVERLKNRIEALFNVEYIELRDALLEFAFAPIGKKFSPSQDQVRYLNKLVYECIMLNSDPIDSFNYCISQVWSSKNQHVDSETSDALSHFFADSPALLLRRDRLINEAKKLRSFSLIQVPALRIYLIYISNLMPRYNNWSEEKVLQLNKLLSFEKLLQLTSESLYDLIFEKLMPELQDNKYKYIDIFKRYLDNATNSCKELALGIKLFDNMIEPLDLLKEWLTKNFTERDAVIERLALIAKKTENDVTRFFKNFWHKIIQINSLTSSINVEALLEFLQQELNINLLSKEQSPANQILTNVCSELSIAAVYWESIFLLKEKFIDFNFLYQPKFSKFLIEYARQYELFDIYDVAKKLEKIFHVEMNVNDIWNVLVDIFAPGSEKFKKMLISANQDISPNVTLNENINAVKGQVRLSNFKVHSLTFWIKDNFSAVDQFEVMKKIGEFNNNQWTAWQAETINKLASAKDSNAILTTICGFEKGCLIEKYSNEQPVLENTLAKKIIEEARRMNSIQQHVRSSSCLKASPLKKSGGQVLQVSSSSPKAIEFSLSLAAKTDAQTDTLLEDNINNTNLNNSNNYQEAAPRSPSPAK